jgi:dCTP deaminase
MAVLPFVLGQTVVTRDEEFTPTGGAVLIKACDRQQLEGTEACNATYDLRVGDKYRDHRDNGATELRPGQSFPLLPGEAVIIQALEEVHFPNSVFGQIVPKVLLLQVGISNTSSKVDPGYDGPLQITVFNLGKRSHTFQHGAPFCGLYILRVDTSNVRPYRGKSKQMEGTRRGGIWRQMRDFIQRNAGIISSVALLLSVVAALPSVASWIRALFHIL